MHRIVIVVQHDVVSFDLSIPYEVFSRVTLTSGKPAYRVRVCAEHSKIEMAGFGLTFRWGLEQLAEADTIIIPGTEDLSGSVSDALRTAVQRAVAKGTRIASICSGSFTLAASGVLDGLRATTHWRAAADMARLFPKVKVDPNVLFVDNGQILTSAGASAGLDLCLHMVRCDFGATVAADAARLAVMSLEREGGQAQFIVHSAPESNSALGPLLIWLDENLDQPLSLKTIAAHAAISSRTLSRRFLEQIGATPLQWLSRARVRRAQLLLETTRFSVEQIAGRVGFGSSTTLREHFQQQLGISPQRYRRGFSRSDD
ncbi:AraC family transcriptional regulator [Pseudomonas sp. TH49]|uniref:GlxA family transcriptional regulator n=1 Tax=Pseudomonas sp. TH49 TaxID=2796413 RepID=UPI001914885D|nr:helix-turn-helix domain-containing protein [Pseudomonas sp. TH49]MBK5344673.1 AraC family transcriptional regulator [Pseudomonas sp. TH49]